MYDFKNVKGHVEVYCNGEFLFTADSYEEAEREVKEMTQEGSV